MSDYGHDLLFGAFLTPTADEPERVVALAQLTEAAGLDLVTFQDHPYQPGFLDTWTLMSWVAARTTALRLAPDVLNLPLRPPAVLAGAVASLDRLSGGRVGLGLGAGAFWDAIEAAGGRRLSPREAVRGLEEAIDVLRQRWDAGACGRVRVDGEVHRVVGAKRGPAPARDVRRLLNVSGRFAERSTGPLQGPPDQWVEEIVDLALADGVSAFVLGSDDPDDLRRFAAEVAPAVRELVDAERSSTTTSPTTSPTTAAPRAGLS